MKASSLEKPLSAQTFGTLHLLLRIIAGLAVASAAITTICMLTLFVTLDLWLADKYGSPFENAIIIPVFIAVIGAVPSVLAGFVLMTKNKAALRNPLETAYAILNLTLLAFFLKLLFYFDPPHNETFEALILVPIVLLYLASGVAIIRLAKGSVKHSSSPLVK